MEDYEYTGMNSPTALYDEECLNGLADEIGQIVEDINAPETIVTEIEGHLLTILYKLRTEKRQANITYGWDYTIKVDPTRITIEIARKK